MERSESIAALSAALAKAQGQIEGAKKDSANPHFKSRYADLASCWDACREALSKNGLAVIQAPGEAAEGLVEMTTLLTHESGEWISERLTIPLAKVDAQGYGSAVTYARRYALTAMVGIAPEDDDGNAAVAGQGAANNAPRQQRPAPKQEAPSIVEPEEGWSAWTLGLVRHLEAVESEAAIEAARTDKLNQNRINALRTLDQAQYQTIGKAFQDARGRLAKPQQRKAA